MEKKRHHALSSLQGKLPLSFYQPLFIRYVLVGLLNTFFGYGIFALLVYAGISYPLALFVATILGVLFNFKSIGALVFNSHDNRLILRFVVVYIIVYLLNLIGLKLLSLIHINIYYAGAVLLPIIAIVGFAINKRFVFNNE